jgi:hypothetical protein
MRRAFTVLMLAAAVSTGPIAAQNAGSSRNSTRGRNPRWSASRALDRETAAASALERLR